MPRTIASKGERLYLDANVLVYYSYSKQRNDFFRRAKALLQKIESGKFEGVISSLALMELIKSLRQLLIEHGGVRSVEDIEKIILQQIRQLFSIRNIRIVEGRPPDFKPMPEVKDLFYCTVCNEAIAVLQECPGKPDVDRRTGRVVHMGFHAPDVLHIVLAQKLQCDKLATFEWNFKEAQREITPLILQDHNAIW